MTHSVLDNTLTLKIFEVVAEARSLTLRELLEIWEPEADLRAETKARIYESLKRLVNEGLVRKEESSIEDFSIYYVTAEGLLFHQRLVSSGLLEKEELTSRLVG